MAAIRTAGLQPANGINLGGTVENLPAAAGRSSTIPALQFICGIHLVECSKFRSADFTQKKRALSSARFFDSNESAGS